MFSHSMLWGYMAKGATALEALDAIERDMSEICDLRLADAETEEDAEAIEDMYGEARAEIARIRFEHMRAAVETEACPDWAR